MARRALWNDFCFSSEMESLSELNVFKKKQSNPVRIMPTVFSLADIDETISHLPYVSRSSPKRKLMHIIRGYYDIAGDAAPPAAIETDDIIRQLWADADDEAVRSRRKNFNSIRSALNKDLKNLFAKGDNAAGLIIGPANTFTMCEEAKDRVLDRFSGGMGADGRHSLADLLQTVDRLGDALDNIDRLASQNGRSRADALAQLQQRIQSLSQTVDQSLSEASGSAPPADAADGGTADGPSTGSGPAAATGGRDAPAAGSFAAGGAAEEPAPGSGDAADESAVFADEAAAADIVDEEAFAEDFDRIEDDEDVLLEDDITDDIDEFDVEADLADAETPADDPAVDVVEEIIEEDGEDILEEDAALPDEDDLPDEAAADGVQPGFSPNDIESGSNADLAGADGTEAADVIAGDVADSAGVPADGTSAGRESAAAEREQGSDAAGSSAAGGAAEGPAPGFGEAAGASAGDADETPAAQVVDEDAFAEDFDIIEDDEDVLLEDDATEDIDEIDVEADSADDPAVDVVEEDAASLDEDDLVDAIGPAGGSGGTEAASDDGAGGGEDPLSADQLGLSAMDFEDTADLDADALKQDRLLAEAFDGFLGVLDRYYNQYLLIPAGPYPVGGQTPTATRGENRPQTIQLPDFYMGQFPVTNALFEIFVAKTGYRTEAEKAGYGLVYCGRYRKEENPDTGLRRSIFNSAVECQTVSGAFWYQPLGPGSNLHQKRDHPVVQVSVKDAMAFAAWTGKRLPTEAEWEAAMDTAQGPGFPWGEQWNPQAGNFERSGLGGTSAVDRYHSFANAHGICDGLGNVLEWTQDTLEQRSGQKAPHYIAKGGSWLTSGPVTLQQRFPQRPGTWSNILGFRCVAA